MFAMRFHYVKVLFHIFYYYWEGIIIDCFKCTNNFLIQRFGKSSFHCKFANSWLVMLGVKFDFRLRYFFLG